MKWRQTTFLLVFVLMACQPDRGQFLWTWSQDQGKGEMEKRTYFPKNFRKAKRLPMFKTNQTIWWRFLFLDGPREDAYTASLARKTFSWVEVGQKQIEVMDSSLTDKLRVRHPGCYRIGIYHEGKQVGQAHFKARPARPETYSRDLDLDDPEKDEIIKFSRITEDSIPCP